jgi:hypothetical protein
MKIYFTASINQKKQFGEYYDRAIALMIKLGHTVQHEHVTNKELADLQQETSEDGSKYYKEMVKSIIRADLVVVEASFPSTLNIGHEISLAIERGKPVVMLANKGYDSLLLSSSDSEKLIFVEYTTDNLEKELEQSLTYSRDQVDTRFNFFISPKHSNYLDWISKNRRIPRSVFLRNLIKDDMQRNNDYAA